MKRTTFAGFGLFACFWLTFLASERALATATATGQISFSNLQITPNLGTFVILTNWFSSTYAQATANTDFDSAAGSTTSSAIGDYSSADGQAIVATPFGLNISGAANASASVPGQIVASDSAAGRGGMATSFMITGGVGPVNTAFSIQISGLASVFTDTYGEVADAETIFSLELDGTPLLFHNQFFSIGSNDDDSANFSLGLNDSIVLDFNTTYFLRIEADAEAFVSNVPEPSTMTLVLAGLAIFFFARRWLRADQRRGLLAIAASCAFASTASAAYIGAETPAPCNQCGAPDNRQPGGNAMTSLTEGNFREDYPVVALNSGNGPTAALQLTYNSYNADASRARIDTGLGFGWTHSYNGFLFQQRSHWFRWDGDGRVTQYRLGPGGVYTADPGFFETLSPQPDGSLIITNKGQSWWRFAFIPNTHFFVNGDMYRLTQMGDRNQNITSLAYTNGVLATVADQYGRTLTFGYTNQFKLANVTDPLGRVTRFQYDAQFRTPTRMTDADGKVTRYTYNSLYQMTRKIDRDGRTYFYTYKNTKPFSVMDGNGQTLYSLSNPTKWDTDRNALALYLRRQYVPAITTKTDALGNAWSYAYDANGYITSIFAPDGATTRYSYDSTTRQVAGVTNANGAVTRYFYDGRGNRTNVTDALGNITTYRYDSVFNQVTNVTDPNGRVTSYQYDHRGNRTNETDALGRTTRYAYDANGNLTSQTDRRGHTTTYSYDAFGNRISTTNANGNVTSYSYDAIGNQVQTTDPLGRTTRYAYDARDRVVGSTNAAGGVTIYQYDGLNRRTTQTDANGNTTTYGYDTRGRMTQTTDANGKTTSAAYDANDNRTAVTNRLGNVTEYQYDSRDRRIREIDPAGGTNRTAYDAEGNVTSRTDPLGRTTQYTYDSLNRLIRETNALGGVTRYDYAAPGGPPCCTPSANSANVTRLEDANGKVTFYKYDELDRPTQIIRKVSDTNDVADLDDAVTTFAYDPVGNRVSETQANGNTVTNAYDALNRITNRYSLTELRYLERFFYDANGNVILRQAENGNTTTNAYDALDRVTSSYDEIGLITTNAYDAVGNRLATTDANGNTTIYSYDGLNRRVTETDPQNRTTMFQYDAVGNLVTNIDRAGRVMTYTYDPLNRRTNTTDALGNVTSSTYDAVGNRLTDIDANGRITTYQYDSLNRRTATIYPDPPPNTITYSYDAVGNLTNRTDQQGRVTTYNYNDLYYRTNRSYSPSGMNDDFTYDKSGRLLSATRGGWITTYSYDGTDRLTGSMQNGRTITYTYDIPGRTRTETYPGGRTITVTNDARTRPLSLHDGTPNPPVTIYSYDAADRVVSRSYRNGIVTTYTYDPNGRKTSAEHFLGITRIAGFGYDYDFEGNRRFEEKRHQLADSEAYGYDRNYRLTNFATGTLVGPVIPSPALLKSWTLDPVGNWSLLVSNSIPELRTHNTANELLTINLAPHVHDDSGNLQQDPGYSYLYDEENRLTRVTRLSDSAIVGQYWYDALGRRIVKIANPAGVATTNLYFYDGVRLLEEQTVGGATVATYTYGNYLDEVLTMDRAGQTFYFHQNSLWSPHALTDASANVVERYTYDAYGCVTILDASYTPLPLNAWGTPHSAVTNSFLFTGHELDEETGLHYFRARYYDCGKGRFLQRDPFGYADGMNLYEFVRGNPINLLDPLGLETPKPAALPSLKEMVAQAESMATRMENQRTVIGREVSVARTQRDVVRVLCLTDKLNQIDVALRLMGERYQALQSAVRRNDTDLAQHEFTILKVFKERADQLAKEADACLSQGACIEGTPTVVEIEEPIEDPTETFPTDLPPRNIDPKPAGLPPEKKINPANPPKPTPPPSIINPNGNRKPSRPQHSSPPPRVPAPLPPPRSPQSSSSQPAQEPSVDPLAFGATGGGESFSGRSGAVPE